MNKQELAVQLKHTGCNCCQAVLCAFAEESGLSELQLRQIGAGFGAGMGCMEATCGALIGAQILLGMNYRDASIRGIYYIPKSKTNCEV